MKQYISVHSHSYTNDYSQGSEDHAAYCICGEYLLQNHNFIIQSSNSSSGHQLVCVCGETKTEAHYTHSYTASNRLMHNKYCACGYLIGSEPHNLMGDGLNNICVHCGYNAGATGGGNIIMKDEEDPLTE